MIVRSNSWTARTVVSLGTLALAAVIFASPANASYRHCNENCQLGDHNCFVVCACVYGKSLCPVTTKKAASAPLRRPTEETGTYTNPTRDPSTHKH